MEEAAVGGERLLAALAQNGAAAQPEFIGQFRVGFYSAFMVADKVTVLTRRAGPGHSCVKWVSDGGDSYTMEETERK